MLQSFCTTSFASFTQFDLNRVMAGKTRTTMAFARA
jgi:hypothetical protein